MADLPEVWQTFRRSSPQWGRIGAHGGGVGADGGASLGPLPQGGRIGATPATVGPIPWPNRKAWPFLTVGMTQPSKKARAVTGPPAALGKTSEDLRPKGCAPPWQGRPPIRPPWGEDLRKTLQQCGRGLPESVEEVPGPVVILVQSIHFGMGRGWGGGGTIVTV